MKVTSRDLPDSKRARVRNSSVSFAIGAVLSLVVQVISVRFLGPASYGNYAAAIAIVALVELTILNRGGELALIALGRAWTGGHREDVRPIVRSLYLADARWLVPAFFGFAILAWFVASHFGVNAKWLALASTSLLLQIGYGADKAQLIVMGLISLQAKLEVAVSVFTAAAALLLLWWLGVWGLLLAYPVAAAFKTLVFRTVAMRQRAGLPHGHSPDAVHLGVLEQGATSLRNLLSSLADQADVILLNALGGGAAAGEFKIAKSLASLPARIVGPFWAALRPEFVAGWYGDNRSSMRRLVRWPILWMAVLSVLAFPVVWIAAPTAIRATYGVEGGRVILPLVVLLAGSWMLNGIAGWYRFLMLLDENKYRSLSWVAVQALWVVGFGFYFASYGAATMALVVAASQIAYAVAAVAWFLRKTSTR